MLGRIGAVCLSFGSRGYYEIIPAAHAGNALSPNAIRELLGKFYLLSHCLLSVCVN